MEVRAPFTAVASPQRLLVDGTPKGRSPGGAARSRPLAEAPGKLGWVWPAQSAGNALAFDGAPGVILGAVCWVMGAGVAVLPPDSFRPGGVTRQERHVLHGNVWHPKRTSTNLGQTVTRLFGVKT